MSERTGEITALLAAAGWDAATTEPLAGDASARRYLRLRRADGARAVLMDAPADDQTPAFARLAGHLRAQGLSAPEILAGDPGRGLLLLEDLGDALYSRVLDSDPSAAMRLYSTAIDAIVALQAAPPPPGLPVFDPATMASLASLVFEWYHPTEAARAEAFRAELEALLAEAMPPPSVLALRDVHADNLVWLPERAGPARAGLLDFQDAVLASPAYDVVSLLNDVRRDVPEPVRAAAIRRFLDATGREAEAFAAEAAVVSVQRQLRILGIFARLAARDGKTGYLRFLPRLWRMLERDLAHPALTSFAQRLRADLPPPDIALRPEVPCP